MAFVVTTMRRARGWQVNASALFCFLLVGSAVATRDLKTQHFGYGDGDDSEGAPDGDGGADGGEVIKLEPCMTMESALKGLAQGDFTSYELTKMFVDRIAEYEDVYNAFTFLNKDPLLDARMSDAKRARGDPLGKLEGIPVVIKEAVDVVGYPSTIGWTPLSEETGGVFLYPTDNAPVTQLMLDAGAILMGKTNIPNFSLSASDADSSWDGPTYNAINKNLLPGGSSAGTATAVAGCFAMWGVGEETGGSIQNPAAAQSLVGIKTTFGMVDTGGVAPLAASLRDVLGPIAKTVTDAALALDVMADSGTSSFRARGYAPAGGFTSLIGKETLKGKKIGLYGKFFDGTNLEPAIKEAYMTAVETIEALGAETIRKPFKGSNLTDTPQSPSGIETLAYDINRYVMGLGLDGGLDEFVEVVGASPFAEDAPLSFFGSNPAYADYLADPSTYPDTSGSLATKANISRVINAVMDEYDLDAFFYPHLGYPLPEADEDNFINAITTFEINVYGGALVTVPGPTPKVDSSMGTLPFSILFWGRPYSEAKLIALAYDYEQATNYRLFPPF